MKKLLFVAPFAFFLGACGAPSVEHLMENPEKLQQVAVECMEMMAQGKDIDTEACNNAAEAQSRMSENIMRGLLDQL